MAVSSTPILLGGPLFSGTYAHQSQTLSQCLNRQTDYGKTEVGP
jgi:hypothetical protein